MNYSKPIESCHSEIAWLYGKKLGSYIYSAGLEWFQEALWIQYFHMCTLVKNFIKAERMGGWPLHVECEKKMIPFFLCGRTLNYAKSARLY